MLQKKKIPSSLEELIGRTPTIKWELGREFSSWGKVFLKCDFFNPGGSVKDRLALALIQYFEEAGSLKPGGVLVEATSGNTGIGLAWLAASRGYKTIFVMPEKVSREKQDLMRAFGSRVVLTKTGLDPDDPGSHYSVAREIARTTPGAVLTNQYDNPANAQFHEKTTGPEIWEDLEKRVDAFVAGAGTGGTISGVARYLKQQNPKTRVVLADPEGSILYDLVKWGEIRTKPQAYHVEGVGEDMVPQNFHREVIDDAVRVTDAEAFVMARKLALRQGLMVGPSSALAMVGAVKWLMTQRPDPERQTAILLPDHGRAYLSKTFNDDWLKSQQMWSEEMLTPQWNFEDGWLRL